MKPFLSVVLVIFVALSALFWEFRETLANSWHLPGPSLRLGNALLFAVTVLAFFLESKGVRAKTSAGFIRYVYLGLILKLFLCIAGVITCVVVYREGITIQVLIAWMLLYAVYTSVEVSQLIKANKALH